MYLVFSKISDWNINYSYKARIVYTSSNNFSYATPDHYYYFTVYIIGQNHD